MQFYISRIFFLIPLWSIQISTSKRYFRSSTSPCTSVYKTVPTLTLATPSIFVTVPSAPKISKYFRNPKSPLNYPNTAVTYFLPAAVQSPKATALAPNSEQALNTSLIQILSEALASKIAELATTLLLPKEIPAVEELAETAIVGKVIPLEDKVLPTIDKVVEMTNVEKKIPVDEVVKTIDVQSVVDDISEIPSLDS